MQLVRKLALSHNRNNFKQMEGHPVVWKIKGFHKNMFGNVEHYMNIPLFLAGYGTRIPRVRSGC